MTLFGIRIRFHVLSPLFFLLLSAFSGAKEALSMLAVLSVHELGHLLTAMLLHARVDEIELMPYGAAIRMYSLWETHPVKLFAISIAGPMANLLLSSLLSLCVTLFPDTSADILPVLKNGLILGFVNLVPALPLDGGRCLCALLSMKVSHAKAVKTGVYLGRIFAVCLIAMGISSFFTSGFFSLFPILCGIFIIASASQEKRQAEGAYLREKLIKENYPQKIRRAVLVVSDREISVYEASKYVLPGESALYAVTDASGKITHFLSDLRIRSALLEGAASSIGEVK